MASYKYYGPSLAFNSLANTISQGFGGASEGMEDALKAMLLRTKGALGEAELEKTGYERTQRPAHERYVGAQTANLERLAQGDPALTELHRAQSGKLQREAMESAQAKSRLEEFQQAWAMTAQMDPRAARAAREALIGMYPDIAGQGAISRTLGREHLTNEQRYMEMTPDEQAEYDAAQRRHKQRTDPFYDEKKRSYDDRHARLEALRERAAKLSPAQQLQFRAYEKNLAHLRSIEGALTDPIRRPPINPGTGRPWTQAEVSLAIDQALGQMQGLVDQVGGTVQSGQPSQSTRQGVMQEFGLE